MKTRAYWVYAMFKNSETLINRSSDPVTRTLRRDALTILSSALSAVEPGQAVRDRVTIKDSTLHVVDFSVNLNDVNRVLVVGGGKAASPMVAAVEELLGQRISGGAVNVLHGAKGAPRFVTLQEASHPVPDQRGVNGVKRMMELCSGLDPGDLVLVLISGGGSSLMPLPAEPLTLADIQEVTRLLLNAGATINELNSVRKHLSAFKGGQLARACSPATVVTLILSDVIGDPLDMIASGPTAPDPTTFRQALNVLEKYGLFSQVSEAVRSRLEAGVEGRVPETPKPEDPLFRDVHNYVIGNNLAAANASALKAAELGYSSMVLSTFIEGEAREVGKVVAGLAKGVSRDGVPVAPPLALILGGETTVKVTGRGTGGRNQELALAASESINETRCVIAALGTDGIDGPTDSAGAIVDQETRGRAREIGLNAEATLKNNDSYSYFTELGDHLVTGPTGTNVNDLVLILVR